VHPTRRASGRPYSTKISRACNASFRLLDIHIRKWRYSDSDCGGTDKENKWTALIDNDPKRHSERTIAANLRITTL